MWAFLVYGNIIKMSILAEWLQSRDDKRVLDDLNKYVKDINNLEGDMQDLTDIQLKEKTKEFKKRIEDGSNDIDILTEAFAVVREVSKRTTGMRPFDVQLKGGILLHKGSIVEMKTGEGKTLVAVLSAYLNSILCGSVHIITVNDYLACRDAALMGQIYSALGLKVGVINTQNKSFLYSTDGQEEDRERDEEGYYKVFYQFLQPCERIEAYNADIVYGTNNEFTFDYLRDNLEYDPVSIRQKEHTYAIVDEADSILIDEARNPLIIASDIETPAEFYKQFEGIARKLKVEEDYTVDLKGRSVLLTSEGIGKAEKILKVENLYTEGNQQILHHLENALRAKAIYKKDQAYVVREREVVLVDEFTGRLQHGKRLSGGLHQAIESKEGVATSKESKSVASITFQNYFRMYKKLSGMTGTALTSREEFQKVYQIPVFAVPTHLPLVRVDCRDGIYQTHKGKFEAIVRKIKELQAKGQPVLVGTVSVQQNEELSAELKKAKVIHNVLNAKNHENEGEIIAQAGIRGRVTVATNLAGRGVDIKLGGMHATEEEYNEVKSLGGLFVLGTERHEARRIDNQLRGRSGRQGDEGETQFFVSLEDPLMRVFGSERVLSMARMLNIPEDEEILENRLLSNAIENAQKRIEGHNFDIRKHSLEFDNVIDKHRDEVYSKRRKILHSIDTANTESIDEFIDEDKKKELDVQKAKKVSLQALDISWSNHLSNMQQAQRSVSIRNNPLMEYKTEARRLYENFWKEVYTLINSNI